MRGEVSELGLYEIGDVFADNAFADLGLAPWDTIVHPRWNKHFQSVFLMSVDKDLVKMAETLCVLVENNVVMKDKWAVFSFQQKVIPPIVMTVNGVPQPPKSGYSFQHRIGIAFMRMEDAAMFKMFSDLVYLDLPKQT